MPFAVAEPAGQAADSFPVDDAIGDQTHRPSDHVSPKIPLRRARRGVRPAASASPESRQLRRCRGLIETNICTLCRDRRTAWPTKNFCRSYRGIEPPIEAAVTTLQRPVTPLEI